MAQKYSYRDFMPDVPVVNAHDFRRMSTLCGTNCPVEIFEQYAAARRKFYDNTEHGICLPLDHVPRFMLPAGSYVYEDKHRLQEVNKRLQRLDPEFLLLHDPFTTRGGPGYHLYRCVRNGYKGVSDWLILEMSVQENLRSQTQGVGPVTVLDWPRGRPCKPDYWFVDVVARSLKKNRSGDEDSIHRQSMQDRWEGQVTPIHRRAQLDAASANMIHEEVTDPYFLKQREIPGLAKHRRMSRNPPTPTLRLRFASTLKG